MEMRHQHIGFLLDLSEYSRLEHLPDLHGRRKTIDSLIENLSCTRQPPVTPQGFLVAELRMIEAPSVPLAAQNPR